MTIRLSEFISQLIRNPALAVTVVLTLGVILVGCAERHRHLRLHPGHPAQACDPDGGDF